MGIFVRLLLSLAGGAIGAAAYSAVPLSISFIGGQWLLRDRFASSRPSASDLALAVALIWLVTITTLVFFVRGAKRGYKIGLQMGRDICFAPEPEHNARVELNVAAHAKRNRD